MTATYELTELPAMSILQYTAQVADQSEIPLVIGGMFGRLLEAMERLGLDTDAPTVAWYDMSDGRIDMAAGCPAGEVTAEQAAAEGLTPAELPAAPKAVVTRLRGGVADIGPAWAALFGHVAEQGLTPAGVAREIYLEGGAETETWLLDLQIPVS